MKTKGLNVVNTTSAVNAGPIKGITSRRESFLRSLASYLDTHPRIRSWHGEDVYQRVSDKIKSLPLGYSLYIVVERSGHSDGLLREFPNEIFSDYDCALAEHYWVQFKIIAASSFTRKLVHNDFWKKDLEKVFFSKDYITLLVDSNVNK